MASEKKTQVAILMGSDSDLEVMKSCIKQLESFEIEPIVRILSAHRTPAVACDFAAAAPEKWANPNIFPMCLFPVQNTPHFRQGALRRC